MYPVFFLIFNVYIIIHWILWIMVSVFRRKKGKKTYYVLIHNAGRHQHEKYMGREIPENIKEIKKAFLLEVMCKEWKEKTEKIKKAYRKQSKKTIAGHLKEFSLGFTHDSQKIEGSTLTKKETFNLLRFSLTPSQKPEEDMVEAQKHHKVFLKIINSHPTLSEKTILAWHKEMFKKTKPEFAGRLRTNAVYVTNSESTFPHWKFVPQFVKQFLKEYKKLKKETGQIELAGLLHFRFVSIHPFGDGNGRISRMIMNYVLTENNCPPLNIKYTDREQYYRALEKGQVGEDEMIFLKWFMRYYIRANKKYQ